jgi:hypothetical protein
MKINFWPLLLLFVLVSATQAHAQTLAETLGLSPFWNWKVIETEHFRITFPAKLEDTARKEAQYLEEADSFLSPRLYWHVRYRTPILVVDNVDAGNGLTSATARFGIVLQVAPPDNWFSTQYYDNWLRLLAFHEYTHMLNLDATGGLYDWARYVFGDVLLPNSVWPPWMLEGLAVYDETHYTTAGRGRSPYYDMILRSAAEANMLDKDRFVTLDRVNGTNPYFPFGETIYLFGYELMNRVALSRPQDHLTADKGSNVKDGPVDQVGEHWGDDMLGLLSLRSSYRVPFFINGNVENISGKTWYHHWDELMSSAREHAAAQIKTIKTSPVTRTFNVTRGGGQTLGFSFSPDGKWVAYTRQTPDEENRLYLRHVGGEEAARSEEKISGATSAFTPDSRFVLFSSLRQHSHWERYSELGYFDIQTGSTHFLSDGLRARDPDVSHDGKWVTFTINHDQTTGIAVAPLETTGDELKLGAAHEVFFPERYGNASTPKFSADGETIYFTLHSNGRNAEDLYCIQRTATLGTPAKELVADGSMNRYPAIKMLPGGESQVWFISDRTGVDNLYRLEEARPVMMTNVTTGLAFPGFDHQGNAYADVFSWRGWDVAKIELPTQTVTYSPDALKVEKPDAPPSVPPTTDAHAVPADQFPANDYSIFPSILPRQWAPLVVLGTNTTYIGGEVLGFDALDQHEYLVGGAYNTQVGKADYVGAYQNHQLGVDLTFLTDGYSQNEVFNSDGSLAYYSRQTRYAAGVSYPILYTFSTLTPSIATQLERTNYYAAGSGDAYAKSAYVPYIDGLLTYSQAQGSNLAITTEAGRILQLGGRMSFDSGQTIEKLLLRDTEFWRIDLPVKHSVLVPSIVFQASNQFVNNYAPGNVVVEGRGSGQLINSLPFTDLDQMGVRGYPNTIFYSRRAGVASLDYRFPLAQVYRGWGTNPAYLDNLSGFVFGETAFFPISGTTLPSTGGGVNANLNFFYSLPITLTGEYDYGFRKNDGGAGELIFQLGVVSPITL